MEAHNVIDIKSGKRTSKAKDIPKAIESLIEIGIPLQMVVFKSKTVRSFVDGAPQWAFYVKEDGLHRSKVAKMWFTPHGIIISQMDNWKIAPLSNVAEAVFL